ncbi:hypothetical protein AYR56_09855 [Loigolactobacillus backii]|uniref:Uncharacterized protein n=1 Tax=Loigolactobacillus backii TaxID=375175 RepID=A0A192H181_9LACO|nr:hypothetical protein AYR53_07145 [Loigolactobacillus backii]ANK70425.1 hypothetical protein AYR56_09855 [Loigolactobacillus backii]
MINLTVFRKTCSSYLEGTILDIELNTDNIATKVCLQIKKSSLIVENVTAFAVNVLPFLDYLNNEH